MNGSLKRIKKKSQEGKTTLNDTTNIPFLVGVSIAAVAGIAMIIGITLFVRKLKKDSQFNEDHTVALVY